MWQIFCRVCLNKRTISGRSEFFNDATVKLSRSSRKLTILTCEDENTLIELTSRITEFCGISPTSDNNREEPVLKIGSKSHRQGYHEILFSQIFHYYTLWDVSLVTFNFQHVWYYYTRTILHKQRGWMMKKETRETDILLKPLAYRLLPLIRLRFSRRFNYTLHN